MDLTAGILAANNYEWFKKAIYDLTGIDLNAYKENQMKRRIDTLISKCNVKGYDKYVALLKTDKAKFEEFVNYLTINVSEFYRNTEQWKILDKEIIPDLIARFGTDLKIWSAACSTGDEPYSLIMAFSRYIPLEKIRVYATDLDKQVIAKAKVKKQVQFVQHNLIKDIYREGWHLIVCRNVLIYFTEEAKNEVFIKFYKALARRGVLFIGNTEQIINYRTIGYDRRNPFFYEKPV